jgi:hypothetical protein
LDQWQFLVIFYFYFFDISTQGKGGGGIRTCDLHFIGRGLQSIELTLGEFKKNNVEVELMKNNVLITKKSLDDAQFFHKKLPPLFIR